MSEEAISDETKDYRVYKLCSKNSDKYFIDYTNHKGYMSMVLQNMLMRYRKYGNIPEKYKEFFYLISKNDIFIEELYVFNDYDKAREYILKYKEDNDNYINGRDMIDYVYSDEDRVCYKEKVDKKKYIKEYYDKNKDKYKERYKNNRDVILMTRKAKYVKKNKKV